MSRIRRLSRALRAFARAATAALAATAFLAAAMPACALERGEFGWRSDEVVGRRPLLVIWLHEEDGTPAGELVKYKNYFADTIFGHDGPASERATFEPTVIGYFGELSNRRFSFSRAGLIGPLSVAIKGKDAHEVARIALDAAAAQGGFNFKALDANGDGRIGPDELTVLLIVNPAASRRRQDFSARSFDIPGQDVAFAGRIAMVGENDGFATVNRELFHIVAPTAVDLDGWPQKCFALNRGLTLMAAVNTSNPQQTLYLDPWHKMTAGWTEPRIYPMGKPGKARLAAQNVALPANAEVKRPVLIYDPAKGPSEFFLLEYRTRSRLGFDQDLAGYGLVIWHVMLDAANKPFKAPADHADCKNETLPVATVFARGAPDWQLGGNKVYGASNGPIALKWMDGTDSGVRVSLAEFLSLAWAIDISWTAPGAAGH